MAQAEIANAARIASIWPRATPKPQLARSEQRLAVQIPIDVWRGRARKRLTTGDVSFRGLFVLCRETVEPMQFLRLEVPSTATAPPIVLHGMVAHRIAGTGFGVRLYGMGGQDLLRWETLVSSHRRREPGPDARLARIELRIGSRDQFVFVVSQLVAHGALKICTEERYVVGTRCHLDLVHPDSNEKFELEGVARQVSRAAGQYVMDLVVSD